MTEDKIFNLVRIPKSGRWDLEKCAAMRCKGSNEAFSQDHPDGIGDVPFCKLHHETLIRWQERNPKGSFVPKPGGPLDKEETVHKAEIVETSPNKALAEQAELKAKAVMEQLEAMKIQDQSSMDRASKALQIIKGRIKDLDGIRKKATQPLLESKREIDSWFNPGLNHYKKAEVLLKTKISTFLKAQEQNQDRALEVGDYETASTPQVTTSPGISAISKWKFEITDENQIPREYLTPNLTQLQRTADLQKGKAVVPGVRFYEDKEMRARS